MIIIVCVNCFQSAVKSLCGVISCNNKTQRIQKYLICVYTKLPVFINIHVTGPQTDIWHPESSYIQTILKKKALIPAGNLKINYTVKTTK